MDLANFMKERGEAITKKRELEKQKEIEENELLERARLREIQESITKKNQNVFFQLFNKRKESLTTEKLDKIDIILDEFEFRYGNEGDVYLLKEILDFESVRKVFSLDSNILKRFFSRILPNADKKVILWFLDNKEIRLSMCNLFEKNKFTDNENVNNLIKHYYQAEGNTKFNIKIQDSIDYRIITELLDKIIEENDKLREN